MSDLEKLEALLPKLVHFLPDVRLRTSTSLLFKLESGLLTSVLKYNSTYVQMIADSITESITLLTRGSEEWKNAASAEAQTLNTLCLCVQEMSKHEAGNSDSDTNYSRVLEKLFAVQAYGILEGNARANLDAAITGVGRIHSPTASASSSSKEIGYKEAMTMVNAELEGRQQNKSNQNRGAGAILQSSLCYHGWQFPKVLLTDIDEKLLFDVEVKVKMGHDMAAELLWDCLTDFPAAALMAHPGLLHAVLDVIGSSNSLVAAVPSKCLDAVGAMKWLQELVKVAVKAYEAQLEGRVCSLSTTADDSSSSTGEGKPSASLATNMAQTLQNMRIPSIRVEEDTDSLTTVYGESVVRSSAAMAKVSSPGVCPAPSLPGLAFAACAASLPLLQSSDAGTLAAVASMLRTALPYVKEPSPFENTRVSSVDAAISASGVDRLRLQHLLNRIERIISMQQEPPSLQKIVQMGQYDNSEERCTTRWLAQGASCATLFTAVLELLALMPPNSIDTLAGSPASQPLLNMGTHTLGVVRHVCTFADSLSLAVASEKAISRAWECLAHVDASSYKALQHCQYLLSQASALRGILTKDESISETRMLEQLYDCLCDSVGLLDAKLARDYRDISEYGIIPATVALLVRGLRVGMGDAGVSIVISIFCCDSVSCRNMLVQALHEVMSEEVAVALLTPSFLHTLVLTSVYEGEAKDSAALAEAALQLLQNLLGTAVSHGSTRSLFIRAPAKWAALLAPLKVLEWGLNAPYGHVPTAVTSFAGHLEEFCARSKAGSSPHVASDRALVLGLFHSEAGVRAHCAARMRNELERYYAGSDRFGDVPAARLEVDPFGAGNRFLYLVTWESLRAEQKAFQADKAANTGDGYAGAVKLAAIAFGEQAIPIRVAGLRQLRALLCDSNVLAMAEPSWAVYIAAQASSVLGRFYVYANQSSATMESSDARMCFEAAALLRLLIARCSKVRGAARLLQITDSTSTGRAETAHFSMLPAILAVLQLSPATSEGFAAMTSDIRLYCAQALSLLAISDLFSSSSAALEVQFKLQRSAAGGRFAVTVPALLASAFTLPLSSDDLSQRTTDFEEAVADHDIFHQTGTQLYLGQLQCSSKDTAVSLLANATYLSEIMAATVIPRAELHASIAAVVCKSIALASSHDELRAVLSAAECLTNSMPSISAFYGSERLDQALERLLKSTPQTQKDMMTLSGVLQFLTALVATQRDMGLVALYESVTTAMLFPLFPLMQSNSAPKPVASQVREYQASVNREIVRGQLMLLLQALVALPTTVYSLQNRICDHPLSSMLLNLTSQEGSSRHQAVACAIVQGLYVNHGLYGLQNTAQTTVCLDDLFRATYGDVVHSTIKTAKLLRKPDSVQGYGALVSSLKMLASIAMAAASFAQTGRHVNTTANDLNWRWLVRLFYDRRAEVRLLSLEIYSHLRNMDRYFDQALEAGSEPFPLNKYLRGIAFDDTECLAVRNSALRVLLDARLLYEDASLLGQILAAVEEQLSQRNSLLCPSTLSSALATLTKALVLPGCGTRSTECVQALKIIPLVLELVRGNLAADTEKIAFRRVGVDIVNVSVTGTREWLGRGADDDEAVQVGDMPKPTYNSGWETVWQRQFNGTGRVSLHLALCAACRFLQLIQVGQLADSFKFAQRQFPLVQGVIATLSHETFTAAAAAGCDTGMLGQAEGRSFSALADLLSGVVLRDGAACLGGADQATALLEAVCATMPRLLHFACTSVSAHIGGVNSLLRLLCAVLEHAPAGTRMDSSFILAGLLRARGALAEADISIRARADVCISLLLQRAPSLALSGELLGSSMAVVARGTKVLYDATQRAMEARSAASSPAARKGATAAAAVRLELWATMLLLQNALGSVCCDREEAMGMAENVNFHKALGILIECSEVWAQTEEGSNSTPAFASLYAFINASTHASKSWVPSFAQLSATALSLCCAFCRDSVPGKRLLLTSRDMSATEGVGSVWNCLFSLIALATSRKISSTIRSLSLSVLASVMPCTYSVSQSFVRKSKTSVKYAKDATTQALDTALQQDKGRARPELVALLLEALGACFIAECASRDNGSNFSSAASNAGVLLPSRNFDNDQDGSLHATAATVNKVARENKVITDSTSMPTMLRWVWESYSSSPVVAAALVRFIGKLSAPSVIPSGQLPVNGTFSRKLCLAVATSAEALRIVTEASSSANATVAGMASLALWATMHASEQARANVKKLAASDTFAADMFTKENNSQYGRDQVGRARAALQMLLE